MDLLENTEHQQNNSFIPEKEKKQGWKIKLKSEYQRQPNRLAELFNNSYKAQSLKVKNKVTMEKEKGWEK